MSGSPVIQRGQRTVRHAHGLLPLSGLRTSVHSPFYELKHCPDTKGLLLIERPDRNNSFSFILMARTGFIIGYQSDGPDLDIFVASWDDTSPFTNHGVDAIPFNPSGLTTQTDIYNAGIAAANAFATANGFTYSSFINMFDTSVDVQTLVSSSTARSISFPTLAVNTARQASTTRDALVIASVEIDAALSLTGGAKGTVSLQYADNNTFTTNLKTASVGVNGNTGTLTIGLNTTQAGGGNIVGIVPAGKYYRLFTTNTTGTPTFGTPTIQEILL